jgi:hypothetical protein
LSLDELIQRVLLGQSGPWPIEPKQHSILRLVSACKGRAHAISIGMIGRITNMQEREIKSSVKSLIEDFGIPIGASRHKPYGYFLIVSSDDVDVALRPLANEVISIARRMRKLGGSDIVKEMLGQLRVEME